MRFGLNQNQKKKPNQVPLALAGDPSEFFQNRVNQKKKKKVFLWQEQYIPKIVSYHTFEGNQITSTIFFGGQVWYPVVPANLSNP